MTNHGILFEAMRSALLFKIKATRKEAFAHFLSEMKRDPKYLDHLADEYFHRNYERFDVEQIDKGHSVVFREMPVRRTGPSNKQRVTAELSAMKSRLRSTILMDLELPNGKRLRHATFADCAKAGGWFVAVAKCGKPAEAVDKKLSEADLQNIWKRYEKVAA